MKTIIIPIISIALTLFVSSCAKERNPTLIVTVVEENGLPAANALVHAWPTAGPFDCQNPPCIVDEEDVDQKLFTNELGEVQMTFDNSVVLNVEVEFIKQDLDSLLQPNGLDTLIGRIVVKLEEKRKKTSGNNFREVIIVK